MMRICVQKFGHPWSHVQTCLVWPGVWSDYLVWSEPQNQILIRMKICGLSKGQTEPFFNSLHVKNIFWTQSKKMLFKSDFQLYFISLFHWFKTANFLQQFKPHNINPA